jgi:hypothetical protein
MERFEEIRATRNDVAIVRGSKPATPAQVESAKARCVSRGIDPSTGERVPFRCGRHAVFPQPIEGSPSQIRAAARKRLEALESAPHWSPRP